MTVQTNPNTRTSGIRSLRGKLLSTLLGMCVLLVLLSVNSLQSQSRIQGNVEDASLRDFNPMVEFSIVVQNFMQLPGMLSQHILTDDTNIKAQLEGNINDMLGSGQNSIETMLAAPLSPKTRSTTEQLIKAVPPLTAAAGEVLSLSKVGDQQGAFAKIQEIQGLFITANEGLVVLREEFIEQNQASFEEAKNTYSSSRTASIAILGVALVAAIVLGTSISQSMVNRINNVGTVLNAVAEGDLSLRATPKGKDEITEMAHNVNITLESLKQSVAVIAGKTLQLSQAADSLSEQSQTVSSNAEISALQAILVADASDQANTSINNAAKSTRSMASSMEEIVTTARGTGTVAETAVTLARTTNEKIMLLESTTQEMTSILATTAQLAGSSLGEKGSGTPEIDNFLAEAQKVASQMGQSIASIQGRVKATADSISQISTIVNRINTSQATIIRAVERQADLRIAMDQDLFAAAENSREISKSISMVAEASNKTTFTAEESLSSTENLNQMANAIQLSISQFHY